MKYVNGALQCEEKNFLPDKIHDLLYGFVWLYCIKGSFIVCKHLWNLFLLRLFHPISFTEEYLQKHQLEGDKITHKITNFMCDVCDVSFIILLPTSFWVWMVTLAKPSIEHNAFIALLIWGFIGISLLIGILRDETISSKSKYKTLIALSLSPIFWIKENISNIDKMAEIGLKTIENKKK